MVMAAIPQPTGSDALPKLAAGGRKRCNPANHLLTLRFSTDLGIRFGKRKTLQWMKRRVNSGSRGDQRLMRTSGALKFAQVVLQRFI